MSVDVLNKLLIAERTAASQYQLQHVQCEDWGFEVIAEKFEEEGKEEIEHTNALAERILFLGGQPDFHSHNPVFYGKTIREFLLANLSMERQMIEDLQAAIPTQTNDYGTQKILKDILVDEEETAEWLDAQLELMGVIGEQNYLSLQVKV